MRTCYFLFASHFLFGQFTACTDSYGAATPLGQAELTLQNITTCTGDGHYACWQVQKLLYDSDHKLAYTVNDALADGCTSCNVAALQGLASRIQTAYNQLANLGYPQYQSQALPSIRDWSDPRYRCRNGHDPLDGPDLSGSWYSESGFEFLVVKDVAHESFAVTVYDKFGKILNIGRLRYTGPNQVSSSEFNAVGYVYDDAVQWDGDMWRRKTAGPTPPAPIPTPRDDYYKQSGA